MWGFRGLLAASLVFVACGDNDHIGGGQLLVSPQQGLRTNETGTSTTFTIALTNEPHDDVHVTLASLNTREGTVEPEAMIFTPDEFMVPQIVTVTGVDDDRADGNKL